MSKALLIVDDEQQIRKGLNQYFTSQGYKTYEAENGVEALKVLAQTPINIVISDIMMPQMNGVDLLREVRKQYPMIRMIMITGHVKLEYALACMRKGADDCIFKPLSDMNELNQAVKHSYQRLKKWQQKLEALSTLNKS